jgi:deoxyribodipyrimidine photo-lyase
MLELKETGWMSNRGRQNVASYFARTLALDWRIGAAYFESLLLDYDVHSNYGNWLYVSGVGNDPRNRTFNVKLQAERYDTNNKFQNLWLQTSLF